MDRGPNEKAAERRNLTVRMSTKRCARLALAVSKKVKDLRAALQIYAASSGTATLSAIRGSTASHE